MRLILLCLWPFFVFKFKQMNSCLLVQDLGELIKGSRYSELLIEDGPLSCSLKYQGPLMKPVKFLDVLPNAQVLRPFLKQRIHLLSGLLFLHDGRGQAHFFPIGLLSLGHLVSSFFLLL